MPRQLTIAYIGNFKPSWSTENHVARSLEALGHDVGHYQEDDPVTWAMPPDLLAHYDLVLWTRTWHLPQFDQSGLLARCREQGIPTVGYHLDRWWGLDREHQVYEEPFFQVDLLVTAEGGRAKEWTDAGVHHLWLPPGVVADECGRGTPRREYEADVLFLGNAHRYHPEWLPHRRRLVAELRRRYRHRFKLLPTPGGPQVRGADLADLFASVKVVVGDSCLAGGATHYWSDRIPETLGRGGFLVHPRVEGMAEWYQDGRHLALYELGDWQEMHDLIGRYLDRPDLRAEYTERGMELVRTRDTYAHRMQTVLDHLVQLGLLPSGELRGAGGKTTVRSPQGARATFDLRLGSSDGLVVDEVWHENVYRLEPGDVEGGVVVDLGANVGAFTLWALAHGAAAVLAYEPEGDNFQALCRNLDLNAPAAEGGLYDAKRRAVLGTPGQAALVPGRPGHEGSAHLIPPVDMVTTDHVLVQCEAIDDVLRKALHLAKLQDVDPPEVAVLKLDVEGSEYPIIEALALPLLGSVLRMVIEFHGPGWGGTSPDQVGQLLVKLAEHGHVETLGRPSVGGYVYWRRYDT